MWGTDSKGFRMTDTRTVPGKKGFAKGVSGNPTGKARAKLLTDALRCELTQNPAQARNIARKILALAEGGDLQAATIVFDRIEGRPTQAIEVNTTVTNLTPEERRHRVIELQSRLIGESMSDAEGVPHLGGPDGD
jgi:hypothetical protein